MGERGPLVSVDAAAALSSVIPRDSSPIGDALLDMAGVGQRQETVRWDVLSPTLDVLFQVTPDETASIDVSSEAAYSRTLRNLVLAPDDAAPIDVFSHRVRPSWVLETGDTYPVGVYMFQATEDVWHTWGNPRRAASLIDQTWILDQGRRSSFSVGPGELVGPAITALVEETSLPTSGVETSSVTASNSIGWPAGTTRLKMIGELCALAGFYPPYFDNRGLLRCRPVPDLGLATPAPHGVYPIDAASRVVRGSVVKRNNGWQTPNTYVVVNTSATGVAIVGTYEIPDSSPVSKLQRGFEVVRVIQDQGVQDSAQATLRAQQAAAAEALSFEELTFDATPDPRHDVFDIFGFDGALYQEVAWSLALAPGGPHHHVGRRIYTG